MTRPSDRPLPLVAAVVIWIGLSAIVWGLVLAVLAIPASSWLLLALAVPIAAVGGVSAVRGRSMR